MTVTETVSPETARTMAVGTAAQELQLKRGEFAVALHVGLVRVLVQQGGGRPRVLREEVDRLRSQDGFPEVLLERVRTVGTAEGARLLGISPDRFTKLARAGCFTPVTFYVNRYRTVVWLYLAQELAGFAVREPRLLVGKSPDWLRSRLEGGADCRARDWRSRRVERLLSLAEDPWARAAVLAGTLDPVQLEEVVDDPYERAFLARIRPEPVFGATGSPTAREAQARLMQADEPDEMLWRRVGLIMELDHAREARPAPRPGDGRHLCPDRLHERGPDGAHGFESEYGLGPGVSAGADRGPVARCDAEPASARDHTPAGEPTSVTEPAPAFESARVAEPESVPDPVRDSDPVDGPDSGPAPAPTALPEHALGLLARLGLRRRTSRRARR
ncbi:DUF6397 family protein [Streptomyces sp. NPDC047515]|uniref:DUF6397 family protein n=1 Tax=Streptomyces sp. NPDC047515 TaxID=3155380 RepID=UPI0033D91355